MAMRTIDVRFKSLEELPIAELFGVYGVYVLWAPTARDCPTYLGVSEHARSWAESSFGAGWLMATAADRGARVGAPVDVGSAM
jgi:hypothetical protein